jgi:predicted transcriptional regulator
MTGVELDMVSRRFKELKMDIGHDTPVTVMEFKHNWNLFNDLPVYIWLT